MFKDSSEEFADDVRKMMIHFNLPYIEITVHNESEADKPTSPLTHISHKIEALVNALLGDVMFAGMEEGSFMLNHFENQIEDLMTFSSYLRMKHEKDKLEKVTRDKLKELLEERKRNEVPLPSVFSEALDEILAKHKKRGNKNPLPRKDNETE